MAIRSFSELIPLTFSWPEVPEDQQKVLRNTLRMSVWEILVNGSLAIISAVFCKYVIQEGMIRTLAPYFLKITLGSCGVGVLFTAYIIYKSVTLNTTIKLNKDFNRFAKHVAIVSAAGSLAAFFAHRFIQTDHPIKWIAGHLILPLLSMSLVGLITKCDHAVGLKRSLAAKSDL